MNGLRSERPVPMVARRSVLMLLIVGATLVGCGSSVETGSVSAELQEGLMSRWNAAAQGVTVEMWDFQWTPFDKFPHPTFKGGSEEAYERFAEILLRLYEQKDNFDFLQNNRLFRVQLHYVLLNGQEGIQTTFEEITALLASGFLSSPPTDT